MEVIFFMSHFLSVFYPCYACDGTVRLQKEASFSSSVGGTRTENLCQICFESEHSTAVLPCGHGGMCWDCSLQIFALTEECPMCRSKIELVRILGMVSIDGVKNVMKVDCEAFPL